jgi:hypothetical protein
MADRYWVGGTGNWDGTAGSKWALTSGGAGGQAVPTSADDVFFDAASGANTVTIGAGTAICDSLTMTGFTGTLAFGSNSITCAGSGANTFVGATTYSVTGTPLINITGTGTLTIVPGTVTEANSISFTINNAASNAIGIGGAVRNLTFAGSYTGNLTNGARTIYGNLTLKSGMTLSAGTNPTGFSATSGTQTITSAGLTLDFPINLSGTATYQLVDDLAVGTATTRNFTLTSGTLDLNNRTLTIFGSFVSGNTNIRSILFGTTGNITLTYNNAAGGTIWSASTATNLSITGTPKVNITGNSTAGTRTLGHANTAGGTEANAVSFNISAGSDSITITGNSLAKDLTFSGTFTGTINNNTRTLFGNLTYKTGMTIGAGTFVTSLSATSGTQQITSAALNLDFPITFAGTATYRLLDDLSVGTATSRTITLTSGTLDLNDLTLTNFGVFTSTNSNTRSIAFGTTGNYTNTYNLGGALTIFNMAIATNFSITGTPTVNVTGNSTSGTRRLDYGNTNAPASPEANSISFYITAGSDNIQISSTSYIRNLDFTGSFTGSLVNSTRSIYGNYILNSSMTITAGTLGTSFLATSGTQLIRTFTRNLDFPITFNAPGAIVQLQESLSVGTATSRAIALTAGTLDLNDQSFTIFGSFSSNNGNTRTIAFGTGQFYFSNTAASWRTDNAVGLTMTGSKTVNFTYSGSVGTRSLVNTNASGSAATAINLNVTAGTDIVTGQGFFNNVDFTGYTGAAGFGGNIVGNLKYGAGMTNISSTNTIFQNWTGTQTFTSNAVTCDASLSISAESGITAASCVGTTATVTHGTLSNFSYPVGSTINIASVTPAGYNGTFTVTAATLSSVSYTVGSTLAVGTAFGRISLPTTLQLVGPLTVGSTRTTAFNAGTFDLNNQSFTTGALDADAPNTKTILFGTAEITVTGNNRAVCGTGGNVAAYPFTYTGTGRINCVYSGSVGTRTIGHSGTTEANNLNYFISAGSDTFQINGNRTYKEIDFTGFTGTVTITGTGGAAIYGDFTAPVAGAAVGFTGNTLGISFQSSGTQTFTTNGYTFDCPISKFVTSGTLVLADDLNMIASVSTGQFSLGSGTLNSNGKNITCDNFNFNNTATKTLTLTNSTVTITGGASNSGFVGSNSSTTYNLTGSNIVFTTSGTALFSGSGTTTTFPTVTMSGSGQLILGGTSSNFTITNLNNTVQPCTISISAVSTRTNVTNFNLSGTAGNLVTLNSTVAGTQANIRKSSGIVNAQYMYIQDSLADGGAEWNAVNSTNVSNNTGWNFLTTNSGNFFLLF